jgi:hypothetical protein
MKKINTETAALYLLDYIDNIKTEDAYDQSAKKLAKHCIQYLINWHVEPAQNDSKRNTEHNGQK